MLVALSYTNSLEKCCDYMYFIIVSTKMKTNRNLHHNKNMYRETVNKNTRIVNWNLL